MLIDRMMSSVEVNPMLTTIKQVIKMVLFVCRIACFMASYYWNFQWRGDTFCFAIL